MKRALCAPDLFDLSVELLECAAAIKRWYGRSFEPVPVVCCLRRDEVIEHMRRTATAAGIPDDRVRYEGESGEPGITMVARALALRAETIVLGTRARYQRSRGGMKRSICCALFLALSVRGCTASRSENTPMTTEPRGEQASMSNESGLRDLFDRWERVWHEGQYELIIQWLQPNCIRHDEQGDRTVTREAYAAEIAETWLMLQPLGSAWTDAVAQERWTSPPPIKQLQ